MPEVLTNQHTDASEACVERQDRVPAGEETALVEEGVGGQVQLAVDVEDPSSGQVGGGDVEPVTGVLVHEADDEVYILAGPQERPKYRVAFIGPVCDSGYKILQNIPCERKLWKQN
jgi:hypothetical protein